MEMVDTLKALLVREELALENLKIEITRMGYQLQFHKDKIMYLKEQQKRFGGNSVLNKSLYEEIYKQWEEQ